MYSDFFGFLGGGYSGYGPDRSGWRDKSDAAVRREEDAKRRFDALLQESKESTVFPMTRDVVPPNVHLTDACWKTFKQYVLSQGCTTKRREATREERIASKETRKSKVYVISVTIPVHPDEAKEAARIKKEKAAEAALVKKQKQAAAAEKKRLEAEQRAKEQRELEIAVQQEYASVLDFIKEESNKKKRVLGDHDANEHRAESCTESPTKKLKLACPIDSMLNHAQRMHQRRLIDIQQQVFQETSVERTKLLQELEQRMQAKEESLQQEAMKECEKIKTVIQDLASK